MQGRVRLLTADDVPAALALAHAAGWNQTAEDIAMLLRLAPEGCFAMECDGRVVATTTLVPVHEQLAWLGMVLTESSYQRRGFAHRLVEHALEYAGSAGIPTVKLDATDVGRPLYLKLGFRDEQPVERWRGRLEQLRAGDAATLDHTPLFRELSARSEVFFHWGAFALVRPGARARYLGPFVAPDPKSAHRLIERTFRGGAGDLFYWDVLPKNAAALELLRDFGFERARSLVRMVYGPPLPGGEEYVYGISGFELG